MRSAFGEDVHAEAAFVVGLRFAGFDAGGADAAAGGSVGAWITCTVGSLFTDASTRSRQSISVLVLDLA